MKKIFLLSLFSLFSIVILGQRVIHDDLQVTGSAVVSGTLSTTTITSTGITVEGTATVTTVSITGGTITGTAAMRGNASFTTSATRVAVYIPGTTSNDYFMIQPVAGTASTRPVADDFCTSFPKADSLVVQRAVGTTSGLSFDWIRIK